jgi:hypothetical protein
MCPLASAYVTCTAKDSDSDSDNAGLSREPAARLAAVPDFDGRRYCRVCKDFVPLAAFPRGQRRFTCRTHLWQRVGKRAQARLFEQPRKRLLARMWMQLWKDRLVFGQTLVELKQADVDALLEAFLGPQPISELAVLPRDPGVPLSSTNAVLAPKQARRELLAGYTAGTYQERLALAVAGVHCGRL